MIRLEKDICFCLKCNHKLGYVDDLTNQIHKNVAGIPLKLNANNEFDYIYNCGNCGFNNQLTLRVATTLKLVKIIK